MWTLLPAALLPLVMAGGSQAPRAASENRCAVCHLRIVWTTSAITHADEWVTSKHAWFGVGCEKCHGGDARTNDASAAHRGLKNSADPSSSVHRTALIPTCGRCHRSEVGGFVRSAHQQRLSSGDAAAPTCTSCHSSMAADVPSPAGLEARCLQCHRDDPGNRARAARREVEGVDRLRRFLKRARLAIAAVADADRRAWLTRQWTETDVSVRGAVAAVHAFDQRVVEERLRAAEIQAEQLGAQLKKP